MNERNVFDRLLDSVVFIENKANSNCSVLLYGDINGRTSVNPDFVEEDGSVHVSVLPDEYVPVNFLPRFSEDLGHVNNNWIVIVRFVQTNGVTNNEWSGLG